MQWELIQTGHQWNKPGADVELQPQKWGFGLKISYLNSSLFYNYVECEIMAQKIRCQKFVYLVGSLNVADVRPSHYKNCLMYILYIIMSDEGTKLKHFYQTLVKTTWIM